MEPQATDICPVCHQPVKTEFYFCPNCGAKLKQAPLPVSAAAQAKIYFHSVILPWIIFITISKWKGIEYIKSKDSKEKQIGIIACSLLVLSTILTIWMTYVFTQQMIQSSIDSINADLNF